LPGEIKQLNWIISSFNLTSAAFLPFWAQLTDIFGRHAIVQASIIVMIIGSAICTGAPTSAFGVLLLGRALQGVGVAGCNISIRTVLADRVSLSDYALNWTIFTLISGVSFSNGPIIGGYLTRVSWRWCFAINLPVGILSIGLVQLLLRHELLGPQSLRELEGRDTSTQHGRFVTRVLTIDYGGQFLFLWGLGLFILALTWGGGTYPWDSATVLVPLIIGSVLTVSWVIYERSMSTGRRMSRVLPYQRPMIPWELLSQREIGLIFGISFAQGMAMFAVMYFMGLYFALVEGKSAEDSGLSLLFYIPGIAGRLITSGLFIHEEILISFCLVGVLMAMYSSNVWPRQTLPPILLGSITSAVGISVIAWAVHAENRGVACGMMALVGHGVMIRMNPTSLHGLGYFPEETAIIACLTSFAIPFGGVVGLTIMTTVYTNKTVGGQLLPKDGIMWAFVAIIPFMWLCVLLSACLGNVWISKEGGHEVVKGTYLWSIITRKELRRERRARGDGGTGNVSRSQVREDHVV
jgi:MFS family permease